MFVLICCVCLECVHMAFCMNHAMTKKYVTISCTSIYTGIKNSYRNLYSRLLYQLMFEVIAVIVNDYQKTDINAYIKYICGQSYYTLLF